MKKIILYLIFTCLFLSPVRTLARDNVNYWYIKNFESEITVNKDSSLDIVEKITADTGTAYQHGIFRILPTKQYLEGSSIKSPISLKSITDFENKPQPFTTIRDRFNNTVTWKIGDKDKLVTGLNYYKISYHVKNAVRHNQNSDEFYWNLNGNFWDIPIDSYSAKIIFPPEINSKNLELNFYSGSFGDKNSLQVTGRAEGNSVLVKYDKTLEPGQGITLSATFPKGIISPYQPTFWEKYGSNFYYLIIIFIFWLCFSLWRRFGRDPKINPTIAPEFEIPENLAPIEMGMVYSDGSARSQYISASIINLAVHGFLKVKQVEGKRFLQKTDYELVKKQKGKPSSPAENVLYGRLFASNDTVTLSSLKNSFYINIPDIKQKGQEYLTKQDWLVPYSRILVVLFAIFGLGIFVTSLIMFALDINLAISLLISSVIVFIFTPLMSKRTEAGHKLFRRILGFKLYMDKAEKYRQRFLENENLFEKLLPYAIMFGMTKKWINQMKNIYGEKYFATYHPIWFYGAGLTNFNADQFGSYISSISSNMSSTLSSTPSSSGSGGGGFSGGGGGGGGGGGW